MEDHNLEDKYTRLKEILKEIKDGAVIAFSGGVDSSLLLKVCLDVLGRDRILAVTSSSVIIPDRELEGVKELIQKFQLNHRFIHTREMENEDFRKNPPDRCYYCKKMLISHFFEIAGEMGFSHVLEGSNYDDLKDHRPGMKAVKEAGAESPLQKAGLTKKDIRKLARKFGLSTWNKPAMACLSSRIPYGEEITPEKVNMVEKAEDLLFNLGYRQFRVRHHGEIARIEVLSQEFNLIIDDAPQIIYNLKELGFKFVTLDLEGFRSGSMNQLHTPKEPDYTPKGPNY